MGDERTGAGSWVRGLFRRGEEPRAEFPGTTARSDPRQALETVESLLGEAVCRVGEVPRGPSSGVNAFGRRVEWMAAHDSASVVGTAAGLTASGRRAAAFLGAGDLTAACPGIRSAARRCLPLVVHAVLDAGQDHADGHALADAGAFVWFAADAQEAIDLTLLARRIAERSLVPGVVICDAAVGELEVGMPEAALVRSFVGEANDTITAPTPAQALVFGERRRRLPRWFDPARPVAHGVLPTGAGRTASAAGRHAFFARHLPSIANESIEELARLTGRSRDLVRRHRIDGATFAVVAVGATVAQAETVADRMRASGAGKVGVLGISWLRPFPADALREALSGTRVVTVLERCDAAAEVPPLMRDVRAALGPDVPRVLSALHTEPTDDQLEAVVRNMQAGRAARPVLRLGVTSPASGSAYPKREALLQRIQRDYPDLRSSAADHPERAQRVEGVRHPEADPPLAVRRFAHHDSTHDNVARFWGEFTQPCTEGGEEPSVPDPYLSIGTVPAWTSTFHDAPPYRDELPRIDAGACTGCGRCWTFCPHSVIAPLAIGTQPLLEALAKENGKDEVAAKLYRVLRQLGQRINGLLATSPRVTVEASVMNEAFDWLVDQMKVSEEELPAFDRAFRAIADGTAALPLSVTEPFFRDVERETKGGGELLMLAIDARACTGCGICAAACPDDALRMAPRSEEVVAATQEVFRSWERLPDTPGPTIARTGKDERVGPLASILMSRHCAASLPGGDAAEPGSGDRLAVRQLAAVVEFEMQRRMVGRVETLDKLARRLREKIGNEMAGAVAIEDLSHLDRALKDVPHRRVSVAEILEQVGSTGEDTDLDVAYVHRLVRAALEIERLRHEIAQGPHGSGRARFGVVISGESAASWAARFPRNPFGVPVSVELAGDGLDVAVGLARGLLAECTDEARRIRTAELLLEAPPDLPARERELRHLSPGDLTEDERAPCPPVLAICGADAFGACDVAGFSRLLASGLPVKLILLDGRDLVLPLLDASLLALTQHRASVLATSIAQPEHLHRGMAGALDWPGASLIHVHAPSPGRHGFDPRETVERARLAVVSRVHPLLRCDPGGTVPDLEGNPAPDRPWAGSAAGQEQTPADWAAGESRFEPDFFPVEDPAGVPLIAWLSKSPDERGASKPTVPGPNGGRLAVGDSLAAAVVEARDRWLRLQQAAGLIGPAAEEARARATTELRAAHEEEVEALRAEYERKLEEVDKRQLATQAARLRARLLRLAGFGSRGAERRRDSS
jgi:pyruvate/2-oxoacid:ferredoxin oxidoreductase alpha subunit/ferredoxin